MNLSLADFISTAEAVRLAGVSRGTLESWRVKYNIPIQKPSYKVKRWYRPAIVELLTKSTITGPEDEARLADGRRKRI